MTASSRIGVDVGGTKILAGVFDAGGRVHGTARALTPIESQAALLDAFEAIVSELRTPEVGAVGFAVPARVDRATGIALGAVNVPLHELRLRDEMESRLGLPVGVENDAAAPRSPSSGRAPGAGASNLVLLTLGTGVGGGIVIDGALYRGWGELGHMVIVEDGEPCQGACTGRGHVEAYCSGHAAGRLAARCSGPGATAQDLVEQRHPALAEIGRHLGTAIGSLVNIFDPERRGDRRRLRHRGRRAAPRAGARGDHARGARAGRARRSDRLAELGGEAGMIGAGLVGLEALDG